MPIHSTDPLAGRSSLLDCIRAVAITLVLVFHVATRYPTESLDFIAHLFYVYGFLGVDMFFPLSGFLITRFLLKGDDTSVVGPAFFLRRIFRIMPLYYLAIAIYVAASLITGVDRETLGNIWAPLAFLTGWFIFFNGPDLVPYQITWSLSVEEFAYVLFGGIAWVARKHFRAFVILCCLLPLVLRTWLYMQGASDIYFLPIARLDAIAYGGLTAILLHHRMRAQTILLGLLALAIVLGQWGEAMSQSMFLTQIALSVCCVITLFETKMKDMQVRWLRPFALFGFYSYFIYLFHFFNIYFIFEVTSRLGFGSLPFWIVVALTMIMTYVQAVLSYRYFEGPLMAYGRTLEPGRKARA